MPALQINIKFYSKVPTVEFSVENAPANSQDLKGKKSPQDHLAKLHIYAAEEGFTWRGATEHVRASSGMETSCLNAQQEKIPCYLKN